MGRELRILQLDDEPRTCGSCVACCVAPSIDAAADYPQAKPPRQRCRHLDDYGRGCSIYAGRCQVCREYRCLWLQGALGVGNRPDKLGVIWRASYLPDGQPYLSAMELRPLAYESPRNERFRDELVTDFELISVVRADGTHYWWSPTSLDLVKRASEIEQKVDAERAAIARSAELMREALAREPVDLGIAGR